MNIDEYSEHSGTQPYTPHPHTVPVCIVLYSERIERFTEDQAFLRIARAFEDRLYIVRTHYCIWG
jgi:hypothetical protein